MERLLSIRTVHGTSVSLFKCRTNPAIGYPCTTHNQDMAKLGSLITPSVCRYRGMRSSYLWPSSKEGCRKVPEGPNHERLRARRLAIDRYRPFLLLLLARNFPTFPSSTGDRSHGANDRRGSTIRGLGACAEHLSTSWGDHDAQRLRRRLAGR